jgi:hypothetical protein
MAAKPRKSRRSTREFVTREELANWRFDAGDMDAPETAAANVSPELLPQLGRPAVHDWFRIAVEMCWHLSGEGPWGKREEFISNMLAWCKQELHVAPSDDELRRRIGTVRQRFPRR